MAALEGIKEIVNQVAIQAATAVMMVHKTWRQDPSQPLWQVIWSQKGRGTANQYL